MKFKKTVTKSMASGTRKYKYTQQTEDGSGLVIETERKGVTIKGDTILMSTQDLQDFAQTLSIAWSQHRKAQPNLKLNLAGH